MVEYGRGYVVMFPKGQKIQQTLRHENQILSETLIILYHLKKKYTLGAEERPLPK